MNELTPDEYRTWRAFLEYGHGGEAKRNAAMVAAAVVNAINAIAAGLGGGKPEVVTAQEIIDQHRAEEWTPAEMEQDEISSRMYSVFGNPNG